MKLLLKLICGLILTAPAANGQAGFRFSADVNGTTLYENGEPVYYYRKNPKSATGEYICNNYLHPLYGLNGDTLTEEFPSDHLFHRGVFWAWHQLYSGNKNLGDGWTNQGISYEVTGMKDSITERSASLIVNVLWKSDSIGKKPFIDEKTVITAVRRSGKMRIIEFDIVLTPVVKDLRIGGSDDEKGYGGFCVRMKLPPDMVFRSESGPVEPQNLQLRAGTWMDFTGNLSGNGKSGITITNHSDNPGDDNLWILRRKASMQNSTFPGRKPVSVDKPLRLRYRLVVHEGDLPE